MSPAFCGLKIGMMYIIEEGKMMPEDACICGFDAVI